MKKYIISLTALLALFSAAVSVQANTVAKPKIDSGDTAWMIVAIAFVLLMSIP